MREVIIECPLTDVKRSPVYRRLQPHAPSGYAPDLAWSKYFEYIGIMEEIDVIRALAALAHGIRLRVFRMLIVAGPGGLTPSVIVEQLGIPNATLSFHLKELTHAGLVTQEREGRHLIYRAEFAQMNAVLGFLTDNCCQGEPCLDLGLTPATRKASCS